MTKSVLTDEEKNLALMGVGLIKEMLEKGEHQKLKNIFRDMYDLKSLRAFAKNPMSILSANKRNHIIEFAKNNDKYIETDQILFDRIILGMGLNKSSQSPLSLLQGEYFCFQKDDTTGKIINGTIIINHNKKDCYTTFIHKSTQNIQSLNSERDFIHKGYCILSGSNIYFVGIGSDDGGYVRTSIVNYNNMPHDNPLIGIILTVDYPNHIPFAWKTVLFSTKKWKFIDSIGESFIYSLLKNSVKDNDVLYSSRSY